MSDRTTNPTADQNGRGIVSEAAALRRWLFDIALPLWWNVGADRVRGGFHDAIDQNGIPAARPRRARSIARQAFSYAEAGRLGWNGPWRAAAQHALEYLEKHFIRADATVVSSVALDGTVYDGSFDLYEQAFALLAFASGKRQSGEAERWRRHAVALREELLRCYEHPMGGFLEDCAGRLPRRSNPHMHLLEAALAWMVVDDDPAWRKMADGIALLCLKRFIDPASGALREFFAEDWSPAAGIEGRICEPGHHYEWAFLLDRWARLTARRRPEQVSQLIVFADTRGLDPKRAVVINSVLSDGGAHDQVARLWAQAERARVYLAEQRTESDLTAAIRGLWRFLATPEPGLWFDQLTAEGRLVVEPARATSLYHVIGVIAELCADNTATSTSRALQGN
jgi:mannose-6-phosphate isomerase